MFTLKEQQHPEKEPVFQQKMRHQERMKPNLKWMPLDGSESNLSSTKTPPVVRLL